MSLIKCSECGKEISDKSKSCVHCGTSLKKEEKNTCPECGKTIKNGRCLKCGYEVKNGDMDYSNNNKSSNNNGGGALGGIVIFMVIGIVICLMSWGVSGFLSNSTNGNLSKKITGCYYITNHIFEGRETSLCINKSSVTFNHEGSSSTLYPDWTSDTLYIRNEYEDILFSCTSSRENNNSIKCDYNNKILGVGSNVWEKN